MAIREIVLLGDPVLRRRAEDVDAIDEDLSKLVRDMFETMYHAEGIGLAAPQVGVSKRILVIDLRERESATPGRIALLNPAVVEVSRRTERVAEGCLSIPGLEEVVERPWWVAVEALDMKGERVRIEADDLFARALQHEIDHLEGILFPDRVSPLKRQLLLAKWKKLREEGAPRSS